MKQQQSVFVAVLPGDIVGQQYQCSWATCQHGCRVSTRSGASLSVADTFRAHLHDRASPWVTVMCGPSLKVAPQHLESFTAKALRPTLDALSDWIIDQLTGKKNAATCSFQLCIARENQSLFNYLKGFSEQAWQPNNILVNIGDIYLTSQILTYFYFVNKVGEFCSYTAPLLS